MHFVTTPTTVTSACEDYLEKIHHLIESKGYARAVDIASALGVSQASVSAMIQRLDAEGYVVYEKYRGLTLTEHGRNVAKKLPIVMRFLLDYSVILALMKRRFTKMWKVWSIIYLAKRCMRSLCLPKSWIVMLHWLPICGNVSKMGKSNTFLHARRGTVCWWMTQSPG